MPHNKLREIIEEHRFSLELRDIIKNCERADEFIDGAKWVLSRDATHGRRIGESHVWFLPMKERPGILPIVIYYTFNKNSVFFLSIQETIYSPE